MSLKVEVLERSFEKVRPKADDFASSFYETLFADYPQAKPLFANTNMAEQKKKLLSALVLVIENLRNPKVLADSLKGLGARHVKYGTLPEHYPLVGNALLKTFEQYLGSDWTPEVKRAWVNAYGAITELMLEGADYSAKDVKLEQKSQSSSPAETPMPSFNLAPLAISLMGGGLLVALLLLVF